MGSCSVLPIDCCEPDVCEYFTALLRWLSAWLSDFRSAVNSKLYLAGMRTVAEWSPSQKQSG